jgi:hypothetical protein
MIGAGVTGLSEDYLGSFIWNAVSNWYAVDGTPIANTSASWDANDRYSGNGGALFLKNSTTNAAKLTAIGEDVGVSFTDIISMEDYAKDYNLDRPYINNANGNRIKQFKPLDSLVVMNTPVYQSSSSSYQSYAEVNLFNEGDDAIYIHSISFVGDGTNQMLDFDNTTPATNLAGNANYGWKPDSTSNNPVMEARIEYVSDSWNSTTDLLPSNSVFDTDMMKTYRNEGSNSLYIPPKPLQYLGNDNVSEEQAIAINPLSNQTTPDIIGSNLEVYGFDNGTSLNSEWIFEKGLNPSTTNTPMGNVPIRLKMKVSAVGTLADYGDYYATMKVVYFRNERSNRYKNQVASDVEIAIPNSDIVLHEMSVVIKMTVASAAQLYVTDTENETFEDNSTIDFGNLNLG